MTLPRIGASTSSPVQAPRNTVGGDAKPTTQLDRDLQSLKDSLRELTAEAAKGEKAAKAANDKKSAGKDLTGLSIQGGKSFGEWLIMQGFKDMVAKGG